jgi:hypothetical protein
MADDARKNARKTRGRPFETGNPGRPKGSRHKTTLAAEALLDGEAGVLTRKAIELAKKGDIAALRLCLDRIIAPRKDRPVAFELPKIEKIGDAAKSMAAILNAVASGKVSPSEGGEISRIVDSFAKSLEMVELERRISALEQHAKAGRIR